jgi:pyruvate/2-oxoglutarate dehydrogenase complex dihydrolipoamide acyltransferase (E2) component
MNIWESSQHPCPQDQPVARLDESDSESDTCAGASAPDSTDLWRLARTLTPRKYMYRSEVKTRARRDFDAASPPSSTSLYAVPCSTMPPRKKAAASASADAGDASTAPTRATRSSARTKAPISDATDAAPAAATFAPASKAKKAPAKGKGKRARATEDDEDAEEEVEKPSKKKKAKASSSKDDGPDVPDDTAADDDQPDEPKKMVCCTVCYLWMLVHIRVTGYNQETRLCAC